VVVVAHQQAQRQVDQAVVVVDLPDCCPAHLAHQVKEHRAVTLNLT
jgi:hypothetical protein